MPNTNKTLTNLVGGELSPSMYGRIDLPVFAKGLAKAENFIAFPQGGARYRSGFKFVRYTRLNRTGVFIPFQFSDQQAYLIEATDLKFRFYKDDAVITETAKTITGVNTVTSTVTSVAHGFSNGDEIYITGVVGTTELNDKFYLVAGVTANTFTLTDIFGNAINMTTYTAYVSGGTAARVYEINTPYAAADLPYLQYAQSADTMYIAHQSYEPRKLTRAGHANWTLATYVRTSDPFTASTKWPRAVGFIDSGRLVFGGTIDNPETIWASRAPNASGATRFDDFTTGAAATDAVIFTLAPIHGRVDSIQWLSNTSKFLVAGTFSTVRRIYGATEEEPLSPTSVTAKSVNAFGCAYTLPVSNGGSLFYVQRGSKLMRSLDYDLNADGYTTTDRNLVADHLSKPGMKQAIEQQGFPDIVWVTRNDGKLLGLTYKDKEDISGWHRHYVGGSHVDSNSITQIFGKVIWVGRMPRSANTDQLWAIVERRINSQTVRSVEVMADPPTYPHKSDFYTGDEDTDITKFRDAMYETQKDAIHLDMALSYDGSDYGVSASATMTPGAVSGTGVTFTASAAVFTSNMVGRQIWKMYDINGNGGGRAVITGYTSSTVVTCDITSPFNSVSAIPAGSWLLTTTSLSGLEHLEGETIGVVSDGGPVADATVLSGAVTLAAPASKAHVGYRYRGTLETLNIDSGGVTGSAQTKTRNLVKIALRFLNTVGAEFGTDEYNTDRLIFRSLADLTDRPVPVFNGVKEQRYLDGWEAANKKVVVMQNNPLPCTVLSMDLFLETTDE